MFPISFIIIPLFLLYLLFNVIVGYRLGKSKVNKGKLGAIFSLIFAFFPPVNFVFFAFLAFKRTSSVSAS
ncbi:hypothetical protein VEJY3_08090 [Vibrio sp. EJY3]|nr:hypothetical protein VEJY3_08090 [Vibrio sp. EJY3]